MALPPDVEIKPLEIPEGGELVVYRIVRTPDRNSPEYLESFKSHNALGIPPRGLEQTHPLIYEGISVFENPEAAIGTARRFPRIGGYVARLRIRADTGARYLRWGAHGHLTLWGDSLKLAETTVDTIPVDD